MKEKNIYNIDKSAHYFVLMHPLELVFIPFMGYVMGLKSSSSKAKWVECIIVEDRYKVDDNYKVTLKSINENYGTETYYQMDFDTALKCGDIVKKTDNNWHKEKVKLYTHFYKDIFLVTDADTVVFNEK